MSLNDRYDEGWSNGYDSGYRSGQADSKYDYDAGTTDGYADGCSDTKAEFDDLLSALREIESDMFWSLKDGTADDLTAIVARVKVWHNRIRTELEDVPQ